MPISDAVLFNRENVNSYQSMLKGLFEIRGNHPDPCFALVSLYHLLVFYQELHRRLGLKLCRIAPLKKSYFHTNLIGFFHTIFSLFAMHLLKSQVTFFDGKRALLGMYDLEYLSSIFVNGEKLIEIG